jgi:hypothetical protein
VLKTIKDRLFLCLGLALAALLAYDILSRIHHEGTTPAPTAVDGAALGRAYAPTVVSTLADAWTAAADTLAQGKSVVEAQAALHASWEASRAKVFVSNVAPALAKVLPEGSDPKDDAQRAEVVALWRAFARGLKGGR